MGHFKNVIMCEDIRDEIGNKKRNYRLDVMLHTSSR